MATREDTVFEPLEVPSGDMLSSLLQRAIATRSPEASAGLVIAPVVAALVEFDLEGRPVLLSNALVAGERLGARTTVALERRHLGSSVVALCENGDPRLPIVVGVIQPPHASPPAPALMPERRTMIQADNDCYVVDAERQIILRCGESSITLTRAGKVIIKGKYILSRSSGYNKIKGAAVDIN
jgi:hypothetical protein